MVAYTLLYFIMLLIRRSISSSFVLAARTVPGLGLAVRLRFLINFHSFEEYSFTYFNFCITDSERVMQNSGFVYCVFLFFVWFCCNIVCYVISLSSPVFHFSLVFKYFIPFRLRQNVNTTTDTIATTIQSYLLFSTTLFLYC